MAKLVRTTQQADRQILLLDEWWRGNRDRAPELFEQELSMAFRTIGSGTLGPSAPTARHPSS